MTGRKISQKDIKLQFDKADGLKLSHTNLSVRTGQVTLTISCTGELKEKRTLTAVTDDGDIVGKLFILPNSKKTPKKIINVVFVTVKTKLDGQKRKTGTVIPESITLFLNVLHQALVNVDVKEVEIDCTENEFAENFRYLKGIEYGIDESKDQLLQEYVMKKIGSYFQNNL